MCEIIVNWTLTKCIFYVAEYTRSSFFEERCYSIVHNFTNNKIHTYIIISAPFS